MIEDVKKILKPLEIFKVDIDIYAQQICQLSPKTRELTLKEVGRWLERHKTKTYHDNTEFVVEFNFTMSVEAFEALKRGEMPE